MPDEPKDSIGQASGAIKWLVGIAITFVGAALAKLEWIQKFPRSAQFASWFAMFFFLLAILFGVFYAFQLVAVSQRKQKLVEAKAEHAAEDKVEAAQTRLDSANEKLARFHGTTFLMFTIAGLATVICLGLVLLQPASKPPSSQSSSPQTTSEKSAEVTSGPHTLVNVPVHIRGRLSHSHTFLLNEKNGDLWLMICRTDKTVEFKRVQRLKLDGTTPEDVTLAAPPPLKSDVPKQNK
jgi:uncharacterized protein YpmS